MRNATVLCCLVLAAAAVGAATRHEKPEADETKPPVLVLVNPADEGSAEFAESFARACGAGSRNIELPAEEAAMARLAEKLSSEKPGVAVARGRRAAGFASLQLAGAPVVYCRSSLTPERDAPSATVYHEPKPSEQLRRLLKVFPDARKVALVRSAKNPAVNPPLLQGIVGGSGAEILDFPVDSVKDVPARAAEAIAAADVLWVLTDGEVITGPGFEFLITRSMAAKKPLFCGDAELARKGATAAFAPDPESEAREAASLAERALTSPELIAGKVSFPSGRLTLNRKAAAVLGVSFSEGIGNRAPEVIK